MPSKSTNRKTMEMPSFAFWNTYVGGNIGLWLSAFGNTGATAALRAISHRAGLQVVQVKHYVRGQKVKWIIHPIVPISTNDLSVGRSAVELKRKKKKSTRKMALNTTQVVLY